MAVPQIPKSRSKSVKHLHYIIHECGILLPVIDQPRSSSRKLASKNSGLRSSFEFSSRSWFIHTIWEKIWWAYVGTIPATWRQEKTSADKSPLINRLSRSTGLNSLANIQKFQNPFVCAKAEEYPREHQIETSSVSVVLTYPFHRVSLVHLFYCTSKASPAFASSIS